MFVNRVTDDATEIARRIGYYRETARNAGMTFPILSEASVKTHSEGILDGIKNAVTEIEEGADDHITLRLNGPIDPFFGFDVDEVIEKLDQANPQSIHLKISSPGGFLDSANTLYADLRQRVRDGVTLTTEGIGLVASAAVMLLLAGERRIAAEETIVGVHAPRVVVVGVLTKGSLKELNSGLNFWIKQISQYYISRTGQDAAQVAEWLDVEHDTQMTAAEAFGYGFLTENPAGENPAEQEDETQNEEVVPHVGLLTEAEQVIYNAEGDPLSNPYKKETG